MGNDPGRKKAEVKELGINVKKSQVEMSHMGNDPGRKGSEVEELGINVKKEPGRKRARWETIQVDKEPK